MERESFISTLTAHVISLMLFNSLVKQRNSDTPAVNLLPSLRRLWYELSLSLLNKNRKETRFVQRKSVTAFLSASLFIH
jgi:hypothetical protein